MYLVPGGVLSPSHRGVLSPSWGALSPREGVYLVPAGGYLVPGGCVYLAQGCVCLLQGGVSAPGGCTWLGVYLAWGVHLVPGGCTWPKGGVPGQVLPPPCGQNDTRL